MATWAGAVAGRKELVDAVRLQGLRYYTGATLSPFTAFLVLRGLKTLELRVQRHSESALRVARLREHPAVADVLPAWPTRLAPRSRAASNRPAAGWWPLN